MASNRLLVSLENLADPDVLIVGSGPAGVSVAEHLYHSHAGVTIAVVERGDVLSTTSVRNFLQSDDERRAFIEAHQEFLWEGDLAPSAEQPGGMMILALGGRGVVAGAHLPRFYEPDFGLWPDASWPAAGKPRPSHYARAEMLRSVSMWSAEGSAQRWALARLRELGAYPPPWGLDVRPTRDRAVSRGYDSSAGRLWQLLHRDYIVARQRRATPRLWVVPGAYVTRLLHDGGRVEGVLCTDLADPRRNERLVRPDAVVLAASPIESARLSLNSGIDDELPCVGRYLAEHIYCRGQITVKTPASDGGDRCVNVVVPPPGNRASQRFQIDVESEHTPSHPDELRLRLTGSAAMDPIADNCVTTDGSSRDEYGVARAHVTLRYPQERVLGSGGGDAARVAAMADYMERVAAALGGSLDRDVAFLGKGRSHHESGTLRMGTDRETSVVDAYGRVHGIANLHVADASVFPCVGVANPMLTVTAWSYHLVERLLEDTLSGRSVRG